MAATPALAGIRAFVFDAYGTVFDIASAVNACRDEIGPEADRLNGLWRDKQLAYSWLRTAQGRHADFWQVTGDALDFSLETLGIERADLRRRLMDLYLSLEPFPEVAGTLARPLPPMPAGGDRRSRAGPCGAGGWRRDERE